MEIDTEYREQALAMLLGAAQAFIECGEVCRERALFRAAILMECTQPRKLLDGLPKHGDGDEGLLAGPPVVVDGERHFGEMGLTRAGDLWVHGSPLD